MKLYWSYQVTRINQKLATNRGGKWFRINLLFSCFPQILNKGTIHYLPSYLSKNSKSHPWLFSFPHIPYLIYQHILHCALSKYILNLSPHYIHCFIIFIIFHLNYYDDLSALAFFFLNRFYFLNSFRFAEKLKRLYRKISYTLLPCFSYY